MEQYKSSSIYDRLDGFKSFISTFLGVIVAFVGIALVFIISSLEGTREIKVSNKQNAILISQWRDNNTTLFPENKVDVIHYENKDYYFVVKKVSEDNQILEWYFAYDGGIDYIFSDYKFYILTGITIFVSIFVAQINYTTSKNSTMNTEKFLKTMKVYQETKNKVSNNSQYIPAFCSYKNKQLYESVKREIVESADITYDFYKSESFNYDALEDWQKKKLKRIKKIKIERINTSDLLQEKNEFSRRKSLLPIAPETHKRNYLMSSAIQKIITSVLSGMTVAFGIVLGNWILGITYGFTVLLSFIMANIVGSDYANNSLRQRYIAKNDLLNEFDNMVDYFIEQESYIKKVKKVEKPLEFPMILSNNIV